MLLLLVYKYIPVLLNVAFSFPYHPGLEITTLSFPFRIFGSAQEIPLLACSGLLTTNDSADESVKLIYGQRVSASINIVALVIFASSFLCHLGK